MTVVQGDLIDVANFRDDGSVRIRSLVARPAQDSAALVTAAWHDFDVVAGLFSTSQLDPGPAEVQVSMGGWRESWTVTIPDEADPISFATLLDAYVEYDPAIVGQAQSARDGAIVARDAAGGFANAADAARNAAESTYAALTDDIENAADLIRGQVADDADRAEAARQVAETKAGEASSSASAAAGSAGGASTSAGTASEAATTATGARDTAVTARNEAVAAATLAETKAGEATLDADAAEGHANAAVSASGSAGVARAGAESARDDAVAAATTAGGHRDSAIASASAASGSAGAAATSASAADVAKNAAQAAASSFSLSAGTVTTGGPSSSAEVNVTGTTPAYTLNFTIPRGAQGTQGPQGEGLKIDFTPANYGSLPTGLNATTDVGKTAWVQSNNRLYIWNGSSWPAEGSGQVLAGAKGDNGATAYQVAVANGFIGSESEWLLTLVGDSGASAYQVAVANGFVGDQTAWLASLNGEDGADGADHWDDLDGKPATFPATWAGVSGKPSSYPSTWSEVSGKPSTFTPTVGTGATEAKPGNYQPTWSEVSGKPPTFPPIVGAGATDAKQGDWMPAWSDVQSKPSTFPPTIGSGATQAVAGNDPRLSDARTPSDGSVTTVKIADDAVTSAKLSPAVRTSLGKADTAVQIEACDITYWHSGKDTTRATGAGDNVLGIRLQRAVTISEFFARCVTADASGNLVVELRKNGTAVSGTSHSIAAASQVAGTAKTGLTASFAAGDVLTVHITGVGGTPGKGLVVDMKGVIS